MMTVLGSFAIGSVGCAAESGLPGGYDVQISSDFSSEEVSVIESEMSSWSQFKDGPVFSYTIVPAFSLPNEAHVGWSTIVIRKDTKANIVAHGDSGTIAYTSVQGELESYEYNDSYSPDQIGATIYLQNMSDVDSDMYSVSIAHETGHACGLKHTGSGTLMNPDYPTAAHSPTCADLDQYCSLRKVTCPCN